MDKDLASLHEKIDLLTEQLEEQRRQQQAFEDLKNDLLPIGNHLIKLSIDELADIGGDFRVEDLVYLLKRVLRNTHLFIKAMDYFESAMFLAEEGQTLGKQMFNNAVNTLDQYERKGYFKFAQQGMTMMDRIVTEFDEEDVKALSDNIVSILTTVRNMTQPDIMAFANDAVDALRESQPSGSTPGTVELLKELADPNVRKGMSRMLNMLKTLGDTNGVAMKN